MYKKLSLAFYKSCEQLEKYNKADSFLLVKESEELYKLINNLSKFLPQIAEILAYNIREARKYNEFEIVERDSQQLLQIISKTTLSDRFKKPIILTIEKILKILS